MSKIAILGSSVDNFLKSHYDLNMIKKIVHEKINLLAAPEDFILSTGELGPPSMAQDFPNCKKGIYIPVPPNKFSEDWLGKDCVYFNYQLKAANFITITNSDIDGIGHIRKMLQDSDKVISFWVGERAGNTFEQMLLALSMGLEIHHGLDEIMINHDVLVGGWELMKKED